MLLVLRQGGSQQGGEGKGTDAAKQAGDTEKAACFHCGFCWGR